MTRPVSGKAEIVLDYPDKILVGTFGRADKYHARFSANGVFLTLQRGGDTGECRSMCLKFAPILLAGILSELAASASDTAPAEANRAVLRESAEALARALAPAGAPEKELTPDEEVLLLHVME